MDKIIESHNGRIYDITDVSRETMIWTVQNVIDVKDQVKFKVLLANWWSPSPEVGSYRSTK